MDRGRRRERRGGLAVGGEVGVEAGERAGEYEEILGHHLERACAYLEELGPRDERGRLLAARAAARLGASGRRALAREDIGPAVRLLERALALTPEDDPGRRDLSLKLGLALAEAGELSRADALLDDRLRDERRGPWPVIEAMPSTRSMTEPSSAMSARSGWTPVLMARSALALRWRHSPWTGSTLAGLTML